jgi:hypothetical protein
VKARLLEFLLHEKSLNQALYLDPDILVTNKLDQLFERLHTSDIVLTPHLDTDYPDDSLLPNGTLISLAGQFNLGFIGVNDSANAARFLNWWKQKLYEDCVIELLSGYFVDQKFIDFVPSLFDNYWIEKDKGYNVAYWNLHSRMVSREHDKWKCNDGPMYFFHFSGYSPDGPAISSHVPLSVARHTFSNRSDLKGLFETYQDLLFKNAYQESITWPYSFETFTSGRAITNGVRRYYWSLGAERESLGDPFESQGLEEIAASVEEHDRDELNTNRQLEAILNSRAWLWVSRYGRFKSRLNRALGQEH